MISDNIWQFLTIFAYFCQILACIGARFHKSARNHAAAPPAALRSMFSINFAFSTLNTEFPDFNGWETPDIFKYGHKRSLFSIEMIYGNSDIPLVEWQKILLLESETVFRGCEAGRGYFYWLLLKRAQLGCKACFAITRIL